MVKVKLSKKEITHLKEKSSAWTRTRVSRVLRMDAQLPYMNFPLLDLFLSRNFFSISQVTLLI